jgi:hypothetical protein
MKLELNNEIQRKQGKALIPDLESHETWRHICLEMQKRQIFFIN